MNNRKAKYSIDSQFTERWSPRAFTSDEISEEILFSGFEAARWAPSGSNSQPWRFVYSRRGSSSWEKFTGFLNEGNRGWAVKAAALLVIISKKDFKQGDKTIISGTHSFDAGSAWMSFALQMSKMGWMTHGMAGIFYDKIAEEFKLPENYKVEAMIAVGRMGDKKDLPEKLQAREVPSDRVPITSFIGEGHFPSDWRNDDGQK